MPGATRTFTYTIIPSSEDASTISAHARKVLGWACDGDPRITCHGISGDELGVVTLNLTIKARDQWWATQLAQDILNLVLWGIRNKATRLDLQSRRAAPHANRGYGHGRTKRTRTPRQSDTRAPLSADDPELSVTTGTSTDTSSGLAGGISSTSSS